MAEHDQGKFTLSQERRQAALLREQNYLYTIATEKRHEVLFAPYGISFPCYRTLAYLMIHPDGAAPSQIADDLQILRQSMTGVVDALEKRGLVERSADPRDRRRIRVSLLPAGWALGQTLLEIEEDYSRRIQNYMPAQDIQAYHRLEQAMYEAKMAALNEICGERRGL